VDYLDDTIAGGYQQSVLEERLSQFELAWQLERWEEDHQNQDLITLLCTIREKWDEIFSQATDRF